MITTEPITVEHPMVQAFADAGDWYALQDWLEEAAAPRERMTETGLRALADRIKTGVERGWWPTMQRDLAIELYLAGMNEEGQEVARCVLERPRWEEDRAGRLLWNVGSGSENLQTLAVVSQNEEGWEYASPVTPGKWQDGWKPVQRATREEACAAAEEDPGIRADYDDSDQPEYDLAKALLRLSWATAIDGDLLADAIN